MRCTDDNPAGTEVVVTARNRVPADIPPKATTINVCLTFAHPTDRRTFSAPTETVGADMVGGSARKAPPKGNTECEYTHSVTFGNHLLCAPML